ncbi:MAG: c-type cytochrome [Planctomycetaceae bacterium]|nr:c-type cytochrome [Planctomycetaceae bacterium]
MKTLSVVTVLCGLITFCGAGSPWHSAFAQDAPSNQTVHKPFPRNRVRDFYFRQAEQALQSEQPIPELLPQFPGLDGGFFGHWGQNSEESSIDNTLASVDSGNVICNLIHHFGARTQKGVVVQLQSDPTPVNVVFDAERLTFVDSWKSGFLSWGSGRFGIMGGATAAGQRWLNMADCRWILPEGASTQYLGYHRHGRNVVFRYRIGTATVLDRLWLRDDHLVRSLQVDGQLPKQAQLVLLSSVDAGAKSENRDGVVIATANSGGQPVRAQMAADSNATLIAGEGSISFRFAGASERPVHVVLDSKSADAPSTAVGKAATPKELTLPGPGQWTNRTVTTVGQRGSEEDAFAIDTLTIPYVDANPFGTPMRLAGVGVMPDRRIVVSTLQGDVWMISGADGDLSQLRWQRYAAGLYQPLGLVIQNGNVILVGKDQLTRLHDQNDDGEADYYECVTNRYPTTGGHDFATDLHQDQDGRLYWAVGSGDYGLARLEPGSQPESLGNGLRNSNGVGVSPDGNVVLASVQEGSWTAATAIFDTLNGNFYGHGGPRDGHGRQGYDMPLCFLPRGIDNSAGGITFLPDDDRLGPLSGQILGSSYGYCNSYVILREVVNGKAQGGIVPLPGEYLSGACRYAFNPHDGCIYVAGTEGWQSYATENGCLHRLRYTHKPLPLPTKVEARQNGLLVHLNEDVDPSSVQLKNVFCQQWNYLYSGAYGSPEYSAKDPARQGHDHVPVESVHLLPDRRTVFLEIPQLHPVMQFHLHLKLRSPDGRDIVPDAYLSIYELGSAFEQFPGYQLIAKRPWPEFPLAEKFEQDPRLVQQDSFGTNFGWVASARRLTLNAVPGLQYEPRQLRVAPGSRVSLTFHNADPSMPHNVVVLKADKVDEFGSKAMVLASNPRAIATHYVPDDPAEICFSPILNPGDQYTVYFEAPQEAGEYRFLCTYPGHWRVMQGSLYVIPDDQPLPEPDPSLITRRFIRQWTTADLADAADDLSRASRRNGEQLFAIGGCNKCHRMGTDGATIGPDLSKVHERFKGRKLLQQIVEPSSEINKQYQTWVALLHDGTVVTGLMVDQNEQQIVLLPNPLKPDEKVTLGRNQIEELDAATQSTMPNGLLMTFTQQEILDLLKYIETGAP